MSATLTTLNQILQDDYQQDLVESINNGSFIISQMEKNTSRVSGRRAFHAVHVKRSSGVGNRADNESLPNAGNQTYINPTVPLRYSYGRIQITGPSIAATEGGRASFVDGIDEEMKRIQMDMIRDLNRQAWGTSDGVICGLTVANNTTTIGIDTADQVDQIYRQLGDDGSYLEVDIGTATPYNDEYSSAGLYVESVDTTNGTITVTTAITTTAGSKLVRHGSGGASTNSGNPNDGQRELTGMQTMVGTGNVYGITASTYPTWQSGTSTSVGQLTETKVNKLIQQQEMKSGMPITLLVGTDGVGRAASAMLEATRRHVNTVDLKAGWTGVQWSVPLEGMRRSGPIALTFDRDVPTQRLYGLHMPAFIHYSLKEFEWMQRDGSVVRAVADKDAYEATMYRYHELAVMQRNCHFVMTGVTEAN